MVKFGRAIKLWQGMETGKPTDIESLSLELSRACRQELCENTAIPWLNATKWAFRRFEPAREVAPEVS
jgi:hypothetical protein